MERSWVASLPPGEITPGYHWIRYLVGSEGGLTVPEKRTFPTDSRTRIVQHTAQSLSRLAWTAWFLKVGHTGYPETSVTSCQHRLRNIPEEWRSQLHHSWSLKSRSVHHHRLDSVWWAEAFVRSCVHSTVSRAAFFQFSTPQCCHILAPSSRRSFGLPTLLTPSGLVLSIF